MFGSDDEEDEEAEKIKQERVAAYAAKKSKKPALIAKSSVLLGRARSDLDGWLFPGDDNCLPFRKVEELYLACDGMVSVA